MTIYIIVAALVVAAAVALRMWRASKSGKTPEVSETLRGLADSLEAARAAYDAAKERLSRAQADYDRYNAENNKDF